MSTRVASIRSKLLRAHLLLCTTLLACGDDPPTPDAELGTTESPIITNGGFEGMPAFGSWTKATNLNNSPGLTTVPPTSVANLALDPGGTDYTFARTNATPQSQVPNGLVAGPGVPLWPRVGTTSVVVNEYDPFDPPGGTFHQGANRNVNSIRQTFPTTTADIDPTDGKVHVRFVLAPMLESAGHDPDEQPYFFVLVRNATRNTDLFSTFNFSNQPGVPWSSQSVAGGTSSMLFTDWQIFDVAPREDQFLVGESLEVQVYAAGCVPGGHSGSVWVDSFGSTLEGLSISKVAPAGANINSQYTYAFTARNASAGNANTVVVDEILPRNTVFKSVNAPGATCTTPPVDAQGTVACTFPQLVSNASANFSVTVANHQPTGTGTTAGSGTATSATATTLVQTGKTWTANQWRGYSVYITGGTGGGQQRTVLSNTATTLTVPAWTTTPNATSTYIVVNPPGTNATGPIAVSAATSTTVSATAPGWTANQWAGWSVAVVAGTGATNLQRRTIVSNTATTLTISPAWNAGETPSLAGASQIVIAATGTSGIGLGTSTNTGAGSLTDSSADWSDNQWAGWTVTVLDGATAGQTAVIGGNTRTQLTLVANWGTEPANASVYSINLPIDKVTNGNYGIASATTTRLLGPKRDTTIGSGLAFADLAVVKTDNRAAVGPNGTTQYTITVTNNGPNAVTNATVTDTFPAAMTGTTWTCASALGNCDTTAGAASINTTVDLPSGATAVFTVNTTYNIASGQVANVAVVTPPGGVVDNFPDNNASADINQVGVLVGLTVTKTGNGDGTVSSVPAGISCGTGCTTDSEQFATGQTVTLTVVPDAGSTFLGWTGACAGVMTTTCTVTMSAAQSVGVILTRCGNGTLDTGEGCDDGARVDGDGCSAACLVETAQPCNATAPGLIGDPSCVTGQCDATGGAPGVCEVVGCGDGDRAAGEGCDDGNTANGDGCNSACDIETTFACNQTTPGEVDDASCASAICDTTAGLPGTCEAANACGNALVEAGEYCDDGGSANGDGCSSTCKREDGVACAAAGDISCQSNVCNTAGGAPGVCAPANACGNGRVEGLESCDDGNAVNGDACTNTCLRNNGQTCGPSGGASCASGTCDPTSNVCEPALVCGNGIVEAGEYCDDGGTAPGGGCSATCKRENGIACTAAGDISCESGVCDASGGAPGVCEAANACGNGRVEGVESCDDGNTNNTDACSNTCLRNNGQPCGPTGGASCTSGTCDPTSNVCEPALVCGNGIVEAGEYCDDGGTSAGGGCSATCKRENGIACTAAGDVSCESGICDATGGAPGVCEAANTCGNGRVEGAESCDDGNAIAGDACSNTCLINDGQPCGPTGGASCSSGVCDTTGGAPGTCEPAGGCGNGILDAGEGCDDGGVVAGDGCTATCRLENGETCNTMTPGATGDASCASTVCDTTGGGAGTCEPVGCGDGRVNGGEACDDGGVVAGDGCSVSCLIETGEPCGATGDPSCESGQCDPTGGAPGVCEAPGCGDGELAATEGCDDGNTTAGDGCNTACLVENDAACNATAPGLAGDASCASGRCDTTGGGTGVCEMSGCGDGRLDATEGCDDGNTTAGDGCTTTCLVEDGEGCNATAPGLVGNASCDSGACDTAGGAPGVCVREDRDGDGVPDLVDLDDDGDGILDTEEGSGAVDTDGDGVPDAFDLDSDNDGIADVVEAGHGVLACTGGVGANGFCDALETAPESGTPVYGMPVDTDADGVDDYRDLDSDDDGLNDAVEAGTGGADANGDGLVDCTTFGVNGFCDTLETTPDGGVPSDLTPDDTDGDGRADYRDLDSDDDGLGDLVEGNAGCADANRDLVCDRTPGDDPDADGIGAAAEGASSGGTFGDGGAPAQPDTDGDGRPDFRDLDSDDDGLSDLVEGGSACADADANAVCDGDDNDGDGIRSSADGAASEYGDDGATEPPNTDGRGPADYRDLDSDDDGVSDLVEGGSGCTDANNNGVCDRTQGDDPDNDGIGTSADGSPMFGDGTVAPPTDSDGDGTPDFRDLDSDNDRIPDVVETGNGDKDADKDGVIDDDTDADNDGIVDVVDSDPATFGGLTYTDQDPDGDDLPDFQDPDSDNDGIADGAGVSGGGCAASGGAGTSTVALVLGVALFALRRRRRALAIAATTLASGAAVAEEKNFTVERFELSADRRGLFDIEWAEPRGGMAVDVGLWAGYANDPLVVYVDDENGMQRSGSLVENRLGGSLVAAVSPAAWVSLGFEMPLILSQSRNSSSAVSPTMLDSLSSFGSGNLRLIPKLRILRQAKHGIGLALIPALVLPTESGGSNGSYFGDDGVSFAPELALSRAWSKVRLAAAVGYRARPNASLANLSVEDELFARVGLGFQVAEPAELGVTTSWATTASAPFERFNANHLESFAGLSVRVSPVAILFAGGGLGWQNGFGTPDWRALAGVRFGSKDPDPIQREVPRELPPVDTDSDGIIDTADRCPRDAEDKDGFEDTNGCPDPDNDQDTVVDTEDACRDVPGLPLLKGCPDGDSDGIADHEDSCPTEAEDVDGFEDENGCPELDNDKDGVVDLADACRDVPGVIENKGCPDTDGDGDTVVDRLDNCPTEPGDPKNNGCKKKQLVTITQGQLVIMESVYFQLDKAVILPKSFVLLDNVASVLAAHPDLIVQVEGHTDSQGDDAYNKKLSQKRAEAVVAYLVKKKIAKDRLVPKGFGEEQPMGDNATKEGRAQNRRVVFTIVGGNNANVKTNVQGADGETKEK